MVELERVGELYIIKKPFKSDKRFKDVISFTEKELNQLRTLLDQIGKEETNESIITS